MQFVFAFNFLKRKTNRSIQAAVNSDARNPSIEKSGQHLEESHQSAENLPMKEQRPKNADSDGNEQGGEAQQQPGRAGQDGVNSHQNSQAPNTGIAWNMPNGQNFGQMYGGGFGLDPSQAGFQGMDWNNAGMFNPMMQMQMQNGGWGSYPNMMGTVPSNYLDHFTSDADSTYTGMGANPMDFSQGMFGGYGMQGMNPTMAGMTGMNMNNFGGDYGGWSGQQMGSDFGTNTGYYPNGGYNLHHQRHQYPNHNYQNQNRFHGQGPAQRGFGRGSQGNYGPGFTQGHTSRPASRHSPQDGFKQDAAPTHAANDTPVSQNIDSNKSENDMVHQQSPSEKQQERPLQDDSAHAAGKERANDATEDDKSRDVADRVASPGAPAEHTTHDNPPDAQENVGAQNLDIETHHADIVAVRGETPLEANSTDPNQNQEFHNSMVPPTNRTSIGSMQTGMNSSYPTGPEVEYDMPYGQFPSQPHVSNEYPTRGRGRGSFARGSFRGRGGYHLEQSGNFHAVTSAEPVGQGVEGAPTGPKAWREGNTTATTRGRGGYGGSRGGYNASVGSQRAAPEQSRGSSLREDRYVMVSFSSKHLPTAPSTSARRRRSSSPTHSRSPSQSPSRSRRRHRDRSRSPSTDSHHSRRDRSDYRSLPTGDNGSAEDVGDNTYAHSKKKVDRSRDASVDTHERRGGRYDRDEPISSRPEQRRRRRSRSKSPDRKGYVDDVQASEDLQIVDAQDKDDGGRRSHRYEKHRERDRDRNHERDKDRAREKDRDRDRHRDRDRDRGQDRDRRRRRERSTSRDSEDHHHRSHRSRRERNRSRSRSRDRDYYRARDRSRDRQRKREDRHPRSKPESPVAPMRAPIQEEEQEFKIQGRAREKKPPTGPAPLQAPTGPKALSIQSARGHAPISGPTEPSQRRPSVPQSQPTSAISPTADDDPYMQEREARRRERLLKDEERRKSLAQGKAAFAAHAHKRSYDEANTNGEDDTYPDAHIPKQKLSGCEIISSTDDWQAHQPSRQHPLPKSGRRLRDRGRRGRGRGGARGGRAGNAGE